jgi:multiple sugar transport system permease protein
MLKSTLPAPSFRASSPAPAPNWYPTVHSIRSFFSAMLLYGLLAVGIVLTLLPLLWMLAASLMPPGEANSYPPRLWPSAITFEHYAALFTRLDLARYLLNSTLLAGAVTLIALFVNSMAGYAFAKFRFRFRDQLFQSLLGAMVIPAQVAMLPLFLLLKQFGLINTYWGVIVPGMASIFGIFLIRQYLLAVPDSLLDAARMDGAGEFRIYWSLVLPLCRPILVTLAIFTFLGAWNDFMWPLIVLTDSSRYTLPVALANLLGEHVQDTELMMAGSVLTVLPVMLLFVVLQKYYIAGIMLGGMKG